MKVTLILTFISISLFTYSQNQKYESEILDFIIKSEAISDIPNIADYLNISEDYTGDTLIQEIGVYRVWLDISHTKVYFVLKEPRRIIILELTSIESDGLKLCKFLKRWGDDFTTERKSRYFKGLALFTNENNKIFSIDP